MGNGVTGNGVTGNDVTENGITENGITRCAVRGPRGSVREVGSGICGVGWDPPPLSVHGAVAAVAIAAAAAPSIATYHLFLLCAILLSFPPSHIIHVLSLPFPFTRVLSYTSSVAFSASRYGTRDVNPLTCKDKKSARKNNFNL